MLQGSDEVLTNGSSHSESPKLPANSVTSIVKSNMPLTIEESDDVPLTGDKTKKSTNKTDKVLSPENSKPLSNGQTASHCGNKPESESHHKTSTDSQASSSNECSNGAETKWDGSVLVREENMATVLDTKTPRRSLRAAMRPGERFNWLFVTLTKDFI